MPLPIECYMVFAKPEDGLMPGVRDAVSRIAHYRLAEAMREQALVQRSNPHKQYGIYGCAIDVQREVKG